MFKWTRVLQDAVPAPRLVAQLQLWFFFSSCVSDDASAPLAAGRRIVLGALDQQEDVTSSSTLS